VTIDEVRSLAMSLPRTTEALVRDRVKFRVGRIVYLAFSPDERVMGFGFPKEEREALVASEPDKFMMPSQADLRYNWVLVRLEAIDASEMRELVLDAWRMVVPKRVAAAYDALERGREPVWTVDRWRVRPERERDFLDRCPALAPDQLILYGDVDEPGLFWSPAKWESRETLRRWRASARYLAAVGSIEDDVLDHRTHVMTGVPGFLPHDSAGDGTSSS
jgi:hypothetical protein